MFDPAGGTAPDIAGQGLCNPSAALWAFSMLLKHVGQSKLGDKLNAAVRNTISSGNTTGDLGGSLNTEQFTEAVIAKME
jgi:isocitrate/isopropylmalate dehydrogenase